MNFKLLVCPIALLLISCATTHPGNEGVSLSPDSALPLKISGQTTRKSLGEAFQLVEITLENTSDNWIRVNHSKILIGNPAESKLSVVMGRDLRDWAQAMELRLLKDQHNEQMAQMGLIVVGSVAAAAGSKSGNEGLQNVGALAALGGYGWAVSEVISQSIAAAEQSDKAPENHIYKSFSVPGKMYMRKWVLLNKPSGVVVDKLVIELETVEGKRDTYEIKL